MPLSNRPGFHRIKGSTREKVIGYKMAISNCPMQSIVFDQGSDRNVIYTSEKASGEGREFGWA